MKELSPEYYFTINDERLKILFNGLAYVWEVLPRLDTFISQLVGNETIIEGTVMEGAYIEDKFVFIAEGAVVEPGAYIQGPAYIGKNARVRHGAYIRSNVVMLENSILGHASEAKNSLMMAGSQAPHFAYVGDSILGENVNLGAGTKLSNLAINSVKDPLTQKRPSISLNIDNMVFDTGLTKMGAILGDGVQTGCNSVLNPGCLVGKNTLIYANVSLRKGVFPSNSIIKLQQELITVERR